MWWCGNCYGSLPFGEPTTFWPEEGKKCGNCGVLHKSNKCKACNGTGRDQEKTEKYLKTTDGKMQGGYIRCHPCNGNGIDPAETFNWKKNNE